MRRTDLAARAHLVILPMGIGHARPSSLRHDGTVLDAVRHVMEVLAPEERQRAVVQTTTRLLSFPEIEAIFERWWCARNIRRPPMHRAGLTRARRRAAPVTPP